MQYERLNNIKYLYYFFAFLVYIGQSKDVSATWQSKMAEIDSHRHTLFRLDWSRASRILVKTQVVVFHEWACLLFSQFQCLYMLFGLGYIGGFIKSIWMIAKWNTTLDPYIESRRVKLHRMQAIQPADISFIDWRIGNSLRSNIIRMRIQST